MKNNYKNPLSVTFGQIVKYIFYLLLLIPIGILIYTTVPSFSTDIEKITLKY